MIPNESVFIRKFSSQRMNEPTLNSTYLRREEMEEFSKLPTSNSLEYIDHIRDFKTVCRGEPLVIKKILYYHFVRIITHVCRTGFLLTFFSN